MADRADPSPLAAGGIWIAALLGSWAMGMAVLGSINGEVLGCESVAPAAVDTGAAGTGSWMILGAASLVPVLVMTAVAPTRLRFRLIGLAVVVAVSGILVADNWMGLCL